MTLRALLASLLLFGATAQAATLSVDIEIPRLNVAEYHRPYVAVWIEPEAGRDAHSLAIWYDHRMADREGEKWLKDMRQWWRGDGRSLSMPADAISSATRPPGAHTLTADDTAAPLSQLAAGRYVLHIEAAREVGGREVLSLPFQWPPTAPIEHQASGDSELGNAVLRLSP